MKMPKREVDQTRRSWVGKGDKWIFLMAWAVGAEKRSMSILEFQDLLPGRRRSEMEKAWKELRLGLRVGLKPCMFGIHEDCQIFRVESEEITQQALF